MKSTSSTHPSAHRLREFAAGKLSEIDAAEIERHLHECLECIELLATGSHADPLLDRLKQMFPTAGGLENLSLAPAFAADRNSPSTADDPDLGDLPKALLEHPRYRVLEFLRIGGMGIVYKAEHRLLHRQVVMKVIRPDLIDDKEMAQRFVREARMLAKLSHRHVVAVHEAERIGDLFFVVMEFVGGQTLQNYFVTVGRCPSPSRAN